MLALRIPCIIILYWANVSDDHVMWSLLPYGNMVQTRMPGFEQWAGVNDTDGRVSALMESRNACVLCGPFIRGIMIIC